jgi:Domain of unknown function (DUF6968)
MNTVIAKTSLFGQRRGEECFRITVEIGTPYRNGFGPGEWACPVAVHPLFSRLQEAHGEDSLQSLCLAISLAQNLLADFREDGGSLIHANGDAFPLESYAFGIATRDVHRGPVIDHHGIPGVRKHAARLVTR